MTRGNKEDLTKVLIGLLPFGLIALAVMYLFKKIGNPFSAGTAVGNVITGGNQGQASDSGNAQKTIDTAQASATRQNLVPSATERQWANDFFDQLNAMDGLNVFSSTVSAATQANILAIYNAMPYTKSMAMVYLAYGVRTVNNRQSAFLGFIWDETTGTLKEHIDKYTTDPVKTTISHNIDQAIIGYLN